MSRAEVTVLVVDDEESFVDALVVGLKREGFRVLVARDGEAAIALFETMRPDVVLLDVMLPKVSGIDVCRAIRARSRTPVLMVSAKTSELDAVLGLEIGADDYISKPYRLRELVARIRAVLRRSPSETDDERSQDAIEIGPVMLDPESHVVTVDGATVELPRKEFELLEFLMDNAGRVLTRDVLMDRVWGPGYVGDTKTLDVHIKRLRGRIESDPSEPTRILTVRGVGYKYARGEERPARTPSPT
jgi:two-component system, OmpR family, response regulator RegX3